MVGHANESLESQNSIEAQNSLLEQCLEPSMQKMTGGQLWEITVTCTAKNAIVADNVLSLARIKSRFVPVPIDCSVNCQDEAGKKHRNKKFSTRSLDYYEDSRWNG